MAEKCCLNCWHAEDGSGGGHCGQCPCCKPPPKPQPKPKR